MKKPVVAWERKRIMAGALAVALVATAIGFLATAGDPGQAASTPGGPSGSPCPPVYIGNYPNEQDTAWAEDVQGLAHDEDQWFVTQTSALWSFAVDFDLATPFSIFSLPSGVSFQRMPQDLTDAKFNHYGDLDQFGGYVFVPLEGDRGAPPYVSIPIRGIAAFRASDLTLVNWTLIDQGSAAWLAIRQEKDGLFLYSSNSTVSKDEPLYRYSLDMATFENTQNLTASLEPAPASQPGAQRGRFWLNESDEQPLRRPFKTTQGGVFDPSGSFYLINGYYDQSASDQRGGIHVFNARGRLTTESTVDAGDGGFRYEYHPEWSRYEEPEGIDWWDNPPAAPRISGQLHALLLDNDFWGDDVYIKHYSVTDSCPTEADLRVTNLCEPLDETSYSQDFVHCTVSVDNLGPGVPRQVKVLDSLWASLPLSDYTFSVSDSATLVDQGTVQTFALDCAVLETHDYWASAKEFECDLGMIPVNGRVSYSVGYWAFASTADFNHEVWAFSGLSDPDLTNNQAVDAQTYRVKSFLMVRIRESVDPVVAGTTFSYEVAVEKYPLTFSNILAPTNNVIVSISLSSGVSILSATPAELGPGWSCSLGVPGDPSRPTRCSLGNMPPTGLYTSQWKKVNLEVSVLPDTIGPIQIDASVTSDSIALDPRTESLSESTGVVSAADLEVQPQTAQVSVLAGTPMTYEIALVNHGPSAAQGVELRVQLGSGVQFQRAAVAGGGACSYVESPVHELACSFGELMPNEDSPILVYVDVVVQLHVGDGTTITAVAKVTSTTPDPSASNDESTISTIVSARADLEVQSRTGQTSVVAGTPMTYELALVNHGPSAAQEAELRVQLDPGVRFERATVVGAGTCTYIASPVHQLACDFGQLEPNADSPILIYLDVSVLSGVGDGTTIAAVARVASMTLDPTPANDEYTISTAVRAEADLEIRISASCLVCDPSVPIVYTMTIVNHGPSDARDVVVVNTLPLSPDTNKVRYLFDTAGCAVDGNNVLTCAFGTIKAGGSATFEVFIETSGRLGVITYFASVSSSSFDPDLTTNAAAKSVVVTG
ncbi:MAG: hypothetical protein A3K65_03810 [Euryarchaeota archaeon RBG_16_68_12]|nr:MAG: hypothetical protein A3K65_03810 [Euryarchaeota archaeon RBG_16_68_12]